MPGNKYKDDNKNVSMPFNGVRGVRNRAPVVKPKNFRKKIGRAHV